MLSLSVVIYTTFHSLKRINQAVKRINQSMKHTNQTMKR